MNSSFFTSKEFFLYLQRIHMPGFIRFYPHGRNLGEIYLDG